MQLVQSTGLVTRFLEKENGIREGKWSPPPDEEILEAVRIKFSMWTLFGF